MNCKVGYVVMSDGSCQKIDYSVLAKLAKVVEEKKKVLDFVQGKYNDAHPADCTTCAGDPAFYELRSELIRAHYQYMVAVKMFLGALDKFEAEEAKEEAEEKAAEESEDAGDADKALGPEFVFGEKKLRPHCEPWTKNTTYGINRNLCGIVCRLQPSCVGFAIDRKAKWCVWFDDVEPKKDDDVMCTNQKETQYVKKRQAPMNEELWRAVDKVHMFETGLRAALAESHLEADFSNEKFTFLRDSSTANETITRQEQLLDQLRNYSSTVKDAYELRKELIVLRKQAFWMIVTEAEKRPPWKKKTKEEKEKDIEKLRAEKLKAKAAIPPEGLQDPLEDQPKVLQWSDFPNSQDTQWSQQHPDCPMGTPCFCDCKCRGAPPQNFVEPPPGPPPPPCPPPPPLPPPGQLTAVNEMLSNMMVQQSMGALTISR